MTQIANIVGLLEAGIKTEGLRQKAIATNLANIETPGYKRIGVSFEKMLIKAIESNDDPASVKPQLVRTGNTPVKENGNDVNLELEIGEMIKNSLRHKTYTRLLSKVYNQIEMAINTR